MNGIIDWLGTRTLSATFVSAARPFMGFEDRVNGPADNLS
jgi:hypothetical protein